MYNTYHVSNGVFPIHNTTYAAYRFLADTLFILKPLECSFRKVPLIELNCQTDEGIYLMYYNEATHEYAIITNKQLILLDSNCLYKQTVLEPSFTKKLGSQLAYMYEDRERNLWYATAKNGLYKQPSTAKFFQKRHSLSLLNGASLSSKGSEDTTYWYKTEGREIYIVTRGRVADSIILPKKTVGVFVSQQTMEN